MQQRWINQHKRYFDAILLQVDWTARGQSLTCGIDDYLSLRRRTIGVYPAIALAEWGGDIKVPTHVYEHPSLQKCIDIVSDMVFL